MKCEKVVSRGWCKESRLDVLPTVLAGAAKPVFEAYRTGKTQSGLPNIRGYLVARNYLSDTQTRLFIL